MDDASGDSNDYPAKGNEELENEVDQESMADQVDVQPELWTDNGDPEEDFINQNDSGTQTRDVVHTLIYIFIHMVFAWQMTFSVSDNCVDSLLHIISYFLTMIQYTLGFQTLCDVAESFPKTLFKAKKFVGCCILEGAMVLWQQ
eukprot:Seg1170.4 transcript_id=Seg1170.4/GoldUCD/mRNA.D3Y31 product="hypothetical protein" protein_id=Seg1170.4/GoldUCD/D3Y31